MLWCNRVQEEQLQFLPGKKMKATSFSNPFVRWLLNSDLGLEKWSSIHEHDDSSQIVSEKIYEYRTNVSFVEIKKSRTS